MTKRILTLTLILVCSCAGWMLLSVVIDSRSDRACASMSDAVCDLWGEPHVQAAPTATVDWSANRQQVMELAGSSVQVGLTLEYRKKGLIWFSMYNVSFEGVYTLISPADDEGRVTVRLAPPSPRANYENIVVEAPGIVDWEAKFAESDKPKRPFSRPAPQWTPPPPLNPEIPGGNG